MKTNNLEENAAAKELKRIVLWTIITKQMLDINYSMTLLGSAVDINH